MTPDELYGEAWLLAYEALVRNWLPSATGNNYVSVDAAFGSLESLASDFTSNPLLIRTCARQAFHQVSGLHRLSLYRRPTGLDAFPAGRFLAR